MVRRVHSYADGGKIVKDHTAPEPNPPIKGKPKTDTGAYVTEKPTSAADAMKNTRKKQMEDLGL